MEDTAEIRERLDRIDALSRGGREGRRELLDEIRGLLEEAGGASPAPAETGAGQQRHPPEVPAQGDRPLADNRPETSQEPRGEGADMA